jgi:hypothetical protein
VVHLPDIAREACISDPLLLWAMIVGNCGVFAAYVWIPLSVARVLASQEAIPQPLLWMLAGAFVLSCGVSHAVAVLVVFKAYYGLESGILLLTAAISLVAAAALHRAVRPIRAAVRDYATLQERARTLTVDLERARAERAEEPSGG